MSTTPAFKPTRPYLVYAYSSAMGWDILSESSVKRNAVTAFHRDVNDEWTRNYTAFVLTDIRTGQVLRQVWK